MDHESLEYYRARARQECEAALNAASAKARRVHGELASAYARLVEIAELQLAGELAPDKVTSLAETRHEREEREERSEVGLTS